MPVFIKQGLRELFKKKGFNLQTRQINDSNHQP